MSKLDGYWSTTRSYTTPTTAGDSNGYYTVQPVMRRAEVAAISPDAGFAAILPTWSPPKEEQEGNPARCGSELEQLVYYHRENKNYKGNGRDNRSPGHLQYLNIKDLLARFFMSTYFHIERIPNWRVKCIGITTAVADSDPFSGSHMPIFDYDGNVKKKIKKDVAEFQEKYGLGDAWVYKTKRGYHVYFFCDQVAWEIYWQMVRESKCCHGFKDQVERNGMGVLRVSAKYTAFDIELEYILKSKNLAVVKRPLRKAHIVQELISLGQQCGTHFASLYPQWARYKEDPKEWRSRPKPKGKRGSKKSKSSFSTQELSRMREELIYEQNENEAMAFQGKNEGKIFPDKVDLRKAEMAYLETQPQQHPLDHAAANHNRPPVAEISPLVAEMSSDEYERQRRALWPEPGYGRTEAFREDTPEEEVAEEEVAEEEVAEEEAYASADAAEEGYDPTCDCWSCRRHRGDNGGF